MKLEHTIQRSKKSVKGSIGQTRQAAYVSQWEIVYHEILPISNLFQQLINAKVVYRETVIHHELGGNVSGHLSSCVEKIYNFIAARRNPYVIRQTVSKLHHFIIGQLVTPEYAVRLLSFMENGKSGYLEFRNERFKEKLKKLSDTITKVKLPSFHSDTTMNVPGKKSTQVSEVKDITKTQRLTDIAERRGASLSDILRHALLTKNVF